MVQRAEALRGGEGPGMTALLFSRRKKQANG
jgi:hypothetical protein